MAKTKQSSKFKKSKWIIDKHIGNRIILLDPVNGNVHSLNETGTWIWKQIVKNKSLKEIIEGMLKEYQVGKKQVKADIDAFLGKYIKEKVIEIK